MAPPTSHSQSLVPNPDILTLDRIERDTDRFRFWVHVEQEPIGRCAATPRDPGIAAIVAACRIFPGRVWRSNCGRLSAGFVAAILRARARSSVSACPGL